MHWAAIVHKETWNTEVPDQREGHYENVELMHCIAAVLFHGPSSVGVLYRDCFTDMHITTVAFILALVSYMSDTLKQLC
jgi:hypothetical protein